jgi:hypothetical protein
MMRHCKLEEHKYVFMLSVVDLATRTSAIGLERQQTTLP